MNKWTIEYRPEAQDDLEHLDGSQRKKVLAAICKVASNPLPKADGGYGAPLGNKNGNNLTGLFKIKLLKEGLRIVYELEQNTMEIIVISVRDDETVYKIAQKRRPKK